VRPSVLPSTILSSPSRQLHSTHVIPCVIPLVAFALSLLSARSFISSFHVDLAYRTSFMRGQARQSQVCQVLRIPRGRSPFLTSALMLDLMLFRFASQKPRNADLIPSRTRRRGLSKRAIKSTLKGKGSKAFDTKPCRSAYRYFLPSSFSFLLF